MTVQLPWGWPIVVSTNDDIGRSLIHVGVYDLAVSEVLWRLCDEGTTALDVGANIGIMSALLARRVGAGGRVLCFEANPAVADDLRSNISRWQPFCVADIRVFPIALSDREGTIRLVKPPEFTHNSGVSYVVHGPSTAPAAETSFVPCSRLDSFLAEAGQGGVAKMDVEGHEEAVLKGARGTLEKGSIRDWVFEHYGEYPSPVTEIFESNRYTIFQIQKRFFGPTLVAMSNTIERSTWEPQSYLATLDPTRALDRLKKSGWQVLRRSRPAGLVGGI
jgi:FkbM family methyltransferase